MTFKGKIFWTVLYIIIMTVPVFGQQKSITIKARPTELNYEEAYLFTDSSRVRVGNKWIKFKPVKGRSVIGQVDGKGKKWKDAFSVPSFGGADVIREPMDNGIKETIVIRNPASGLVYDYVMSGVDLSTKDGVIQSPEIIISPPLAWDSVGQVHPSHYELIGDTVRYTITKNDSFPIVYPLYLDPTIIIKSNTGSGQDAHVRNLNPTLNYGTTVSHWLEGSTTNIARYYWKYDLTAVPAGAIIDSLIDSLRIQQAPAAGTATTPARVMQVTSNWDEGTSDGAAPGAGGDTLTWNNQPNFDSTGSYYNWTIPLSHGKWARISPDSGAAYDTLLSWVRGWYDGSITNHGRVLRFANEGLGTRNLDVIDGFESATTANRPSLTIYYTLLTNVYAADSLAFSTLTDSTAKLDSIAGNSLDVSIANVFAIYDTSIGMYLDTTQTAPFKKAKTTYVKSAWKNKLYPFPRNYVTRFIVQAFSVNGSDSLKTAPYEITIGTPPVAGTGVNQGRWDPSTDQIQ